MNSRFKNILIVSDIDGTFLGKKSRIVERNLDAVERFKAEGGLFTFNTGRTFGNLFYAIPEADKIVNAPVGMSNGCCLYDVKNRTALYEYLLEAEPAAKAAKYIFSNFKNVGVRISTREGFLAEPRDEIAVENLKKIGAESYVLAPSEEWTGEDWYKIVLLGEDDELEVIREKLKGIYGGTFGYEKSGRHVIELHRPDRSKASVIDTYRDMFKEQGRALTIYAVGDYENDIEMLKTADVAVCPENALDAVKELCDYILSSNDVGVIADLIEMLERTIV